MSELYQKSPPDWAGIFTPRKPPRKPPRNLPRSSTQTAPLLGHPLRGQPTAGGYAESAAILTHAQSQACIAVAIHIGNKSPANIHIRKYTKIHHLRFARIATMEPNHTKQDITVASSCATSHQATCASVKHKTKTNNIATAMPRNATRSDTISMPHLRWKARLATARAAARAIITPPITIKATLTPHTYELL